MSVSPYNQYTKLTWNMATEAESFTPVNDRVVLLQKGARRLYLVVDTPVSIRFFSRSAESPNYFDSPNPGIQFVGFESVLPMAQKTTFKVCLYPDRLPDYLAEQ
ncbi:MAG: hypothetical protein RR346_07600 [Bacteroidales bacterium]